MSAKTFAELISDDLFNQTMIFFHQIINWKNLPKSIKKTYWLLTFLGGQSE